jgi:acetyl esterase/lipase
MHRRVFLKQALSAPGAAWLAAHAREASASETHHVAYGPGSMQVGDLQLPSGASPHPVVILIHGGFWRMPYALGQLTKLGDVFAQAGVASWNIEYRRLGEPGAGWPGTFLDVAAAADHLRKLATHHPLDLSRVVSLGHSAGGHLAFWLAGRHRIAAGDPLHAPKPLPLTGAVSLAGVVDLALGYELKLGGGAVEELLGGSPKLLPSHYANGSPAALLPLGVRQVLVHGRRDPIVPYAMSEEYAARATKKGDDACLVPLDDTGHFEPIDPTTAAGRRVVEEALKLFHRRVL